MLLIMLRCLKSKKMICATAMDNCRYPNGREIKLDPNFHHCTFALVIDFIGAHSHLFLGASAVSVFVSPNVTLLSLESTISISVAEHLHHHHHHHHHHWIDLRENLQETIVLTIKYMAFL